MATTTSSEEIVELEAGVSISLPVGTSFQFRAHTPHALELVIATVPAWPGEDEALRVDGVWD